MDDIAEKWRLHFHGAIGASAMQLPVGYEFLWKSKGKELSLYSFTRQNASKKIFR